MGGGWRRKWFYKNDIFTIFLSLKLYFSLGFKKYLQQGGASFFFFLQNVVNNTGGRVRFFVPLDNGEGYCDMFGNVFPVPIFPAGRNIGKLQFEVQANHTRVFCTMHRGVVEGAFARDYQWQLTAERQAVE